MKPEFVRSVVDRDVIFKQYRYKMFGRWVYYTTIHPNFSSSVKRPWKFVNGKLTQDY